MKKKIASVLLAFVCWHAYCQNQSSTEITTFNLGQSFSCIALDTSYDVWAGTNKKGLFRLGNSLQGPSGAFQLVPIESGSVNLSNFVIQTLAADKLDNLWVGHSGNGGSTAGGGGIECIKTQSLSLLKHYSADQNEDCHPFISKDGIPTRNSLGIAVDEYNTVWSAHRYHDVTAEDYILTPGSLAYKRVNSNSFIYMSSWEAMKAGHEAPELPYPAYTCKIPISKSGGTRTCNAVACGRSEVWVSVYPYEYATSRSAQFVDGSFRMYYPDATANMPARILIYDLNGVFKKAITFETVGATAGGVFNSICITPNENAWVGLSASKGFAARINGCWTLLNSTNLPGIFLDGASVNNNAIWCNKGQVFIGTTKGLIVYNGVGKVDDPNSYELYSTTSSQLPSNNILGGANERDTIQWVATDNGIARIHSKVNFSISPDYTSCHNEHINSIEKQLKTDLNDRPDFHSYVVETVICTKSGPNDTKCNAQEVYKVMKGNVSFQAPTPKVFTYDNLKLTLLAGLTDAEKNQIVANINAWQENRSEGNSFGGIKYIRQVLTTEMILKYYCINMPLNNFACFDHGQLPFTGAIDQMERDRAEQRQAEANQGHSGVESCTVEYKLYNSFNHVADRALFLPLDRIFCNARLASITYDPVRLYADDQNLTITNYTMDGHFLDPGKVKRFVVEECGKVKVVTIGTGLNYCAQGEIPDVITDTEKKAWNTLFGDKYPVLENELKEEQKKIFKKIAMQLAKQNGTGNIVLGAIMFKNIDLLLKQGFNANN